MSARPPELLAPAGSFMAAYHAFAAGADAVYLGLRRFSARGSAQNFNALELAKLKTLALAERKKIYVALNTVIREDETDDFIAALLDCERLGVDAILLQDPGALELARQAAPDLPRHASTQLAVHNAAGLREAARLGFRRVVLPRELPFEKIRDLRRAFPEIELEVFIHGALCYSYSGLCLASALMGGGSGNRGACAQVCRLGFSCGGREGHFFSCRDLCAGPDARSLAEAGVDSLKIEGRQKSAAYVHHTVRLYRFILDHARPEEEPAYADLLSASGFVFSRERTKGRLFGGRDERLVTERYERSVGLTVGRVEAVSASSFTFTAAAAIAVDDVLQFFLDRHELRPYKLPVKSMTVAGRPVRRAAAGDGVTVESGKVPVVGQEISKVYGRELELPGIRHRRFAPYAPPRPVSIVFNRGDPATVRIETVIDGRPLVFTHPCSFEKIEPRTDTANRIKRSFAAADDHGFRFPADRIDFTGNAADPDRAVGNRTLGKIRDAFARRVAAAETERLREKCAAARAENRAAPAGRAGPVGDRLCDFIGRRERLNPGPGGLIPFYLGGRPAPDSFARLEENVFVPLRPVVEDDEAGYYGPLESLIAGRPDLTFHIGVNNLHHLEVMRDWERYPNAFSFIDFYFYLASAAAIRFACRELRKLVFGYYWIEGDEKRRAGLQRETGFPLFDTGPTFRPPYFIHAGDFARESLGLDPEAIGETFTRPIQYGRRRFEMAVEKGFSFLFPA